MFRHTALLGGRRARRESVRGAPAPASMVAHAVSELDGVDVLINNAGIQISRPSEELSSADFDKVLAVNLRGAFLCAREAIRHFIEAEKPGVIINVSSVHQLIPKPNYLGYSVSKGGMMNLTRTLALEYAGRGIRVNGIGPGATITPINRAWIEDPVKKEQVESHIPMARAGTADEMGGVACFLASGCQFLVLNDQEIVFSDFVAPSLVVRLDDFARDGVHQLLT